MAATQWGPAPYYTKEEWLLADGTIVTSPDLETSSSGRRVRVVGTKESVGNRQIDTLIHAAIDKIAADRGTTQLVRLFDEKDSDVLAASHVSVKGEVFTQALTLHLLEENVRGGGNGRTTAFFKFKDPTKPLYAWVFLTLEQRRNSDYTIHTHLVWRDMTMPSDNRVVSWDGQYVNSPTIYRYSDEHKRLTEGLAKKPPVDGFEFKEVSYNGQMRTAVVRFADMCKTFDGFDEISVPSTTPGGKSTKFKRVSSNYSAAFNAELLDFVQTGPVLERIRDNYQQLVKDMKMLGIVFTSEIGDSEFAQAVNGDLTKITATVRPNEDTDNTGESLDRYHEVCFDFATGTVVVNCAHAQDLNEVAQAWDIAKFKAEVVGEEQVLLEFAKAYRDPKEQRRLKRIIKQRGTDNL